MKKIILSIVLICSVMLSLGAQNKEKTYNYEGFTGIQASNAFQIHVTKSDNYSIKVEVDPEYEQYLMVKQDGKVLVLGFSEDLPRKMQTKSSKIVSARITMPSLVAVSLSGSADMACNGTFAAGMDEVKLYLSGSSSLKGFMIAAGKVDCQVSGNSHVECEMEVGEVGTKVSGASKVILTGLAGDLEGEVSGASNLNAKDISVETASFEISGASRVQVAPTKELKVSVSGASTCIYKDNDQLVINARSVTGASTLKPASNK